MEALTKLSEFYWYIYGAGCGVIILLMIIRVLINRRQRQVSQSYGSARWASAREVKASGLLGTHGVMLGRYQRNYLRDDSETHILLCGPTRSGKGVSIIIPTLLTLSQDGAGKPWSVMVDDPKDGENYDITAAWRRGPDGRNPVYAFTPRRPPQTRINVLDTVRLKTRLEFGDAQLIAQSLVAPEKMARESQTSLHFRELATHLLTAAILHVLYSEPRKSLAGVWEFMTQAHDSLSACLKMMSTTSHVSHGVHKAIASMTTAIKNITGDREISSVWSTAIRPLVLYNDPLIADSTDASDFDLEDLQYGARPISLYMIAPDPMELERLHPVHRVIKDVAIKRLMEHKVRTAHHRLLLCCDELPSYGYTRVIEKGIPEVAGYGMKALLVCQDLEQLWDVYGPRTAIWGNCRTKVFFAPDNDLTAKRISENMIGQSTVEQEVQHRGGTVQGGTSSTTYQYHGRLHLTPDELMDLPPDQEIIRVTGVKPILAQKLDYRTDANLCRRVL